jgi:hypothetical protein
MQTHTQSSGSRLLSSAHMATMSIEELMESTLRLADLLMEESQCLTEMRVNDIEPLQAEKIALTNLLERYQIRMASDPSFIKAADENKRSELLLLTDDLAFAVEENFRRTSAARAVNSRVMHAIRDVLTEQQSVSTYDRQGQAGHGSNLALSMKLNQKA